MTASPDPPRHPQGFTDTFWLQWHLTDACNLSCRHCYREEGASGRERPLEELRGVLERYAGFLESRRLRGRIQFSGGEPLLAHSLLPLLRQAKERRIPCRVLSNGTTVTDELASRLLRAGSRIVQVSLDGDREAHDALRGEGAFDRALRGVGRLARAGVEVTVAATLGRSNRQTISAVIDAAVTAGAYRVAFARLVPQGAGARLRHELLSPEGWLASQVTMLEVAHRRGIALMPRDPTFILVVPGALPDAKATTCSSAIGGCAAGYNGLAVEPDGTVYPCRRLPVTIGNIFEDDLDTIWSHPTLERLRDRDALGGACGRCDYRWMCGGCRAVPFALTGDMMAEDPQCPLRASPAARALARARQRWYRFAWDNL